MSMARLEATNGGWLELSPYRYQFPSVSGDEYDDNWLDVEFEASLEPAFSVGRRSAPAFLAWELQSFIHSGRELIEGSKDTAGLDGIEPNLALEVRVLSVNHVAVKVSVCLSFAPHRREPFDEPFETTVTVLRSSFLHFLDELERVTLSFPRRSG